MEGIENNQEIMESLKEFEMKLIQTKTVLIIDGKTIGCITKEKETQNYFLKTAT
jgi:hypothetical protein